MNNSYKFCNEYLIPQIYVACLAAYNKGYLHGAWINARQDIDSLYAEIKAMLKSSPVPHAEDFIIHDYRGFDDIDIDEYESLETIVEYAGYVTEESELEIAVLAYTNGNIEDARHLLSKCYRGAYESKEVFAELFAEDTIDIPQHLVRYIDYEKVARDLFRNDYFSINVNNITHVFSYL